MTDAAVAQLEKRLKAVTERLEQVEKQLANSSSSSSSSSGGASSGGAASSGGSGAAFVGAYEGLISQYIDEYVKLSAQIDPDVQKQAEAVRAAVTAQKNFLDIASQSKKPSDSEFSSLLQPTSKAMEAVAKANTKGKAHPKFNYLNTLAEGINALGWVAVTPAPAPFVDEARASSEFYSNKILMEFKNKEGGDVHRGWVHAINEFLKELKNYVKQYHTTGVAWNPKGGDASAASSSSSSSGGGAPPPPVPSGGGPPAPPPGGGPPSFDDSSSSGGGAAGGGRAALLAEIDAVRERQKGGRTEGLKKVTADQKSKNRDPKDVVKVEYKEPTGSAPKAGAKPAVTKPPRIELEGNKWVVEWQQGNKNIQISDTETRQTVYIYKCENSVIQIKGKVNSIVLDGCKKTAVAFENAIASAEMVNCVSIQLQVLGRVPNIAVDKTDGCQVHLSKECLDCEIVTSKVSEMNVNIPHPTDPHGDPIERPVPEQFKTVVKGTSLVTEAVQHLA